VKEFTFHNVTITLSANNSTEAYDKLCEMFARAGVEYETDTYSHAEVDAIERPTHLLWPELGGVR
jgi:hypothetical protein